MKFQCPNCYARYNYEDKYRFFEKLTCSMCTKTYLTSEFLKYKNEEQSPKHEDKIEEKLKEEQEIKKTVKSTLNTIKKEVTTDNTKK